MASVTLVAAAGLLLFMVSTWALSLALRDVSIVDAAWGIAFVIVAWVAYALGDAGLWLALLVSAWGLRLAGYIGWRKLRERREDARYGAWRERWGVRFPIVSLFTVFLFQG
jgi:steroid 5-alpha reductase family enzyme